LHKLLSIQLQVIQLQGDLIVVMKTI